MVCLQLVVAHPFLPLHPCFVSLLQGDDYFKTELARLERMIASGSVKADKLDSFSRKASVLGAFTEKDVDEE
jgi:hypothetical protein